MSVSPCTSVRTQHLWMESRVGAGGIVSTGNIQEHLGDRIYWRWVLRTAKGQEDIQQDTRILTRERGG